MSYKQQPSHSRITWKSGSGNRWSVGMLGPEGGEIVVRASTAQQVEAAAHAVLSMNESRKALQLAYSAMFVHADCDACSTALEAVNTALNS